MKKLSKRMITDQHSVKAFWSCYCVGACACPYSTNEAQYATNYTPSENENHDANYKVGPRSIDGIDSI